MPMAQPDIAHEKNFGESSIAPAMQEASIEKNVEEKLLKTTSQTKSDMVSFGRDLKLSRVKRLRELRAKNCPIPNFKSKLWALRILDEVKGKSAFQEYRRDKRDSTEMQDDDELVISGTDVEALFPSLRDVESAKVVREAVLKSDIRIENFDWKTAIKYLYIVGGPTHVKECGLERIAPS